MAEGKRLFTTGLGRWSYKGQGWGACASCHIDGLTDGVTWSFARGPRQSLSVDPAFGRKDGKLQRAFGWNASFDEVSDLENGVVRGMWGGVGLIVKDPGLSNGNRIDYEALGHGGLNGSSLAVSDPSNPLKLADPGVLDDWGVGARAPADVSFAGDALHAAAARLVQLDRGLRRRHRMSRPPSALDDLRRQASLRPLRDLRWRRASLHT